MSTPSTSIYLCAGVPLTNRYDHTLYFANATAQLNYFSGKVVRTLNAYSFVRRTWTLKVAATMEAARVWSYLYFQNGTGKRYFYFINTVEYINDATVELSLELDVIQTYMFEWTIRPCYVEREHSVTDVIGANTIDEGLDVGEYRTAYSNEYQLSNDLVIMCAATIDINKFYISGDQTVDKTVGALYDKIFGGFSLYAVPLNNWQSFSVMLNYLSEHGQEDAIFTLWEYPARLVQTNNGSYESVVAPYVSGSKSGTFAIDNPPTSLNGYTPKNNKLYQYPYRIMYATNNNGGAAVYHYEKFYNPENIVFRVTGNLSPDAIIRMSPLNYKGVTDENIDESLTVSNFPLCAWNSDSYKMWLAQNQNQQNLGYAVSGLKILGGVAAIAGGVLATGGTGGAGAGVGVAGVSAGVGMIASGATDIASQLAQRADREIQPPQAKGSYSGSHNVSNSILKFTIKHNTIDAYHAEMIDNYFSMYGYATRKVKVPNISSRPAWNYVKTIGSNVTGDFCMEDLQRINSIFDHGITFWKNTDVGNYSLNNQP